LLVAAEMAQEKKYDAFVYVALKPLTYLLDIYLPEAEREKYRPHIYDTYRYVDNYEEGNAKAALLEGFDKVKAKKRPIYRCRIWGLSKLKPLESGLSLAQYNALCGLAKMRVLRRLDPEDGWVKCAIDHVDCHGRLIVRLYDRRTGYLINSTLLNKEFSPIFRIYHGDGCASSRRPSFGGRRSFRALPYRTPVKTIPKLSAPAAKAKQNGLGIKNLSLQPIAS